MSYETVIEQVKMLPEQLLASVSAFIKLLEAQQGDFTENYSDRAKSDRNYRLSGKTSDYFVY
ncbi:hypothetical protein E4N82_12700 [Treponema denticola]|uniref:hypothetical protein n=1 Tax=Treponema denticola TaxID=158 RepID=UPI0021F88A26|nr:hypothetical protein [Treponema denticola]UYT08118.1 hypothetical protein OE909_01400 [Treponema denticola]